jgi:bifunctional non-homologous end joining protein LigD
VLFAFDLLELDGEDLRSMPIETRKRKLAQLVRHVGSGLHLSDHLHGHGTEVFEHACKLGCEGKRTRQRRRSNGRRRRTGAK